MPDPFRLAPLLMLFTVALLVVFARRLRLTLTERRDRRLAAEAREYERMTGWVSKIRPDGAGPAITRDRHGRVELFKGLRRYSRKGPRGRKSREV
jgi:hypothetical protein